MHRPSFLLILGMFLTLSGCNSEGTVTTMDDLSTRPVTLPDGTQIRAEVMIQEKDMRRGMMFRDSFPEGRGMLFLHGSPNKYGYWMYQVKIPLDIIWLDRSRRVVEISANTPPCLTPASQCKQYGGNYDALSVLELPGGYAAKHGIKPGEIIQF